MRVLGSHSAPPRSTGGPPESTSAVRKYRCSCAREPVAFLASMNKLMRLIHGGRARLFLGLLLGWLLIGTSTRVALAIHTHELATTLVWLPYGLLLDGLVGLVALAPLALFVALGSGSMLSNVWLRSSLVCIVAGGATFGAFVEFFFFDEFDARFNHVALDYLLFPGEVVGNVWESYPVPLYVALALAFGTTCAWVIHRALKTSSFERRPLRARLLSVAGVVSVAAVAVWVLILIPPLANPDRRTNEIGSNGLVQLVRAFQTATLDYESYYSTLPEPERARLVHEALGWNPTDNPVRQFTAVDRRDRPLDIVVVLSESFGSEFVGSLGGRKPNAPGLERWAAQSLFLTNVVPTGNRTVRGLEGVLCSFLPLPGDSVWKRNVSGFATLAGVLQGEGYRTEFVYGGDGAFDRMKSFATTNGWQNFFEDSLVGQSSYPESAFRTVWGVDDESMFTKLLERQRRAKSDGARFFGTALTVSNHKPFLTPDTKETGWRMEKVQSAAIWAAGLFVMSIVAWLLFARRARRPLLITVGFVWVSFGIYSWIKVQPRDSREAAVRYADRAFAEYLDTAKAEGLLEHTVVLFVGDHGARVYGSEEIPAASYRVPAMFVAPDTKYHGVTIPRLCSQIDLAPTLLSLAGVDYSAPFFGQDLLRLPADAPGRAYLIHNRNIGLLTDTALVVLGLQRRNTLYRRSDRSSDVFELAPAAPDLMDVERLAAAAFQTASAAYESGRFRLTDAP